MINGERVKQARELRGYTQTELAGRVGVKQAAISQIEGGKTSPTQEVIEAVAFQTGFPIAFFRQTASIEFPLGSLLFRARASITSRERDIARQYGKLIFEIAEKMERQFDSRPFRLPKVSNLTPSYAAQLTRSELGLSPDTPIQHLVNVLEKNGILVLVLPKPLPEYDAYSVWIVSDAPRPVIVISGETSGDRLRFNVAHELGHLVMHHSIKGDLSTIEQEANLFAGEFLVPEVTARQDLILPVTLSSVANLKPKWKVSMQVLIRRALDLEIITYRQYVYLIKQISIRGWRKKEPNNLDIPIEKPRALRQMTEVIYGVPLDYKKIAEEMNISAQLAQEIFEAHTPSNREVQTHSGAEKAKILMFSRKKKFPENI